MNLHLNREFGASVAAKCQRIGKLRTHEYWITDSTGLHHQLDYSGPTNTIAPEILLAEEVNWESLRMDESILNDLEYYEDQRCEAILDDIMAQAEQQQWDEWEEEFL